jgi:hypothetical protein
MGAVHRTNSTSVMNGVVEIIVARIVRYARFQPLKCGWESPKNLGATASMKFHGVSPEPIFETSYPSCGLQRATGLQGGRGPLEVRCRQEIPFDPKGVERAEGGSLLRCIRRVTRLQLQSDRGSGQEIWRANRPVRGPPDPRVRNWSRLASNSVVAHERSRRNVPENVLSIIQAVHGPHRPPPLLCGPAQQSCVS